MQVDDTDPPPLRVASTPRRTGELGGRGNTGLRVGWRATTGLGLTAEGWGCRLAVAYE